MSNNLNKRRMFISVRVAGALIAAGCAKEEAKPAAPVAVVAPLLDVQTLISKVGAEPGPLQRSDGAAAMIAASEGTIEVRRLGQESFLPIRNGTLQPGDQVRVSADARATILFADTTSAEIAEVSSLSIGSRSATADPASSAAVLSGIVRFSVAPRVPGEGPFVVFTPAGVVATKGTVFGVGVAASGAARVGVESGAVEVAGAVALDAPATVAANGAIDVTAQGSLGKIASFPKDDWGVWREQADGALDVAALAVLHGNALASLSTDLSASYDGLHTLGAQVAAFEAEAALAAEREDTASYQKALVEGAAAIDASFLSALRTEWLTHAYTAHATIASELYLRHPDAVVWTNFGSNVDAAVLWPKRFEATVVALLEPMRLAYYLHSARGRTQAPFVGLAIPSFYASVTPPAMPPARAKLKFKAFVPPLPVATSNAHGLWIAGPTAGWHTQLRATPAPLRAPGAFYVKPAKLRARVLLGADVKAKLPMRFEPRPALPRAQLKGSWKLALGEKIELPPANLGAARTARGALLAGVQVPTLSAPAVAASVSARADTQVEAPDLELEGKVQGKAKLKAKLPEAKARLKGATARAELRAQARAEKAQLEAEASRVSATVNREVEASAKLELTPPEVRAPKLNGAVNGSAKLSLGL